MTGLTSTGAVFAAALVFVGVAVFEAWWVFEVVFGAGAALGVVAAPGPKGWCLMMCGVARDELELPPMNFRPPAARTANSRPQIAAIRTGGESVSVTSFLLATRSRDLKCTKGAVARALRVRWCYLELRAGAADDVGAGAGLVPDLAADRALHAVGDRVCGLDEQLGRDDGRVVRLQQGNGHARIACGRARAGVVGDVRLDGRDRCSNVRLCGGVVRAVAEAQVRRNRDREQDAQDDDDNEKFDEGETGFLTGQPLPDLGAH